VRAAAACRLQGSLSPALPAAPCRQGERGAVCLCLHTSIREVACLGRSQRFRRSPSTLAAPCPLATRCFWPCMPLGIQATTPTALACFNHLQHLAPSGCRHEHAGTPLARRQTMWMGVDVLSTTPALAQCTA